MVLYKNFKKVGFNMRILNKSEYITNHFENDKYIYNSQSLIKTGIDGLDEHLLIRPGVYLLGGLPSVGKTTFSLQLADHFANIGKKVLFFSLEQTEYDLTTKSINRIQKLLNCTCDKATAEYKKYSSNITTAISDSHVTIEEIEDVVNKYVSEIGEAPIVFVDYLQFIQTKTPMSKRDGVTHVSNMLVGLAKTHGITMFVLSSLNRMNYMSPIDFESFKESGSLEYDADVVLGLQYQIISNDKFINCSSVDQKRLMIGEAKVADIRKVELVCLKNRFGPIAPVCKLDYHTSADLFVDPKKETQSTKSNRRTCSF